MIFLFIIFLIIAYFLKMLGFDTMFIFGMYQYFHIVIDVNGYYFSFFFIGLAFDLLNELKDLVKYIVKR